MYKIITSFLAIFFGITGATSQIVQGMRCEGEMPEEFKKHISDFVSSGEGKFHQKSLLNVYSILNSGEVVYGNESWKTIHRIGQNIMSKNGISGTVHFYLIRSGSYNAFATDEGFIFATTGLLSQAENEEEVAFILCHELAHYLLHHNLERSEMAEKSMKQLLKDRKASKKNNPDRRQAADFEKFLTDYYAFSRANELQADSLGFHLYIKSGYAAGTATKNIAKLQYRFPAFQRYRFDYTRITGNRNPLSEMFMTDTCTYLKNKHIHLSGYDAKKEEAEALDSDSLNERYASHPEWQEREAKLKAMANGNVEMTSTLLPENVRFQALCESYLHHLKNTEPATAMCYLQILENDFPNTKDLAHWKAVTASAIYFRYVSNKIRRENILEENYTGADCFSGLMRFIASVSEQEWRMLMAIQHSKLRNESKQFVPVHNHYILKYLAKRNEDLEARASIYEVSKKTDSVPVIDSAEFTFKGSFCNSTTTQVQSTIVPSLWNRYYADTANGNTAIVAAIPKVVYNAAILEHGSYIPMVKSDSVIVVTPGIQNVGQSWKQVEYDAFTINDYQNYFVTEISRYGKKNKVPYNILDYTSKVEFSTETYNRYRFTGEITRELLFTTDTNLYPVYLISYPEAYAYLQNKRIQFVACLYDERPVNVPMRMFTNFFVLNYSIPFGIDIVSFVGDRKRNIRVFNCIMNPSQGRLEYIGAYEYHLKISKPIVSAMAQRIVTDYKRIFSNER